ncbi:hypothetical protein [Serratia silvae]|uniref:Uncharacterized protein n=1 Tax=Serratia silvae TaxID=2824122 RepID=A0ABT0KHS1_9GAMM|nr:hypothetical protein [Serratia silvae]MCL1031327.1 hypothetical protein [Serratia silvae]
MEKQHVNITQMRVGDIVYAHGARFRIKEIRNYALSSYPTRQGPQHVAVNKDWNFQGNHNVSLWIEPRSH